MPWPARRALIAWLLAAIFDGSKPEGASDAVFLDEVADAEALFDQVYPKHPAKPALRVLNVSFDDFAVHWPTSASCRPICAS